MKLFTGPSLAQFALKRPDGVTPLKIVKAPASVAKPIPMQAPKPEFRARSPNRQIEIPTDGASRLRLVQITRLAQGGRWRVEAMRSLSEPLLLWFTRGQGRITVAGITRGYGVHNAVFIPAGTMHCFDLGPLSQGVAVYFGRDNDVSLPAEPRHLRVREAAPQGELTGILENIQRELDGSRPGNQRAARHHLGLLGVWLERQSELALADKRRPDAAHRLVQRYSAILEQEFRSGQGVAGYAAALGVTPTHLTRVCKQCCSRSASELLHDRTIFEARKLLAETRMPVNRISANLGFTSAAYFTRAFQARTGMTPSGFRKQS